MGIFICQSNKVSTWHRIAIIYQRSDFDICLVTEKKKTITVLFCYCFVIHRLS